MAERFIHGPEYTCGILDGQALPLVRMSTPRDFYDYQAKYFADDTEYFCPCGLSPVLEQQIQTMSLQAFDALGGRGWGRIDWLMDQQQQAWLLEANTAPGMTDHSLVPMAAKQIGLDFGDLVVRILETTLDQTGHV